MSWWIWLLLFSILAFAWDRYEARYRRVRQRHLDEGANAETALWERQKLGSRPKRKVVNNTGHYEVTGSDFTTADPVLAQAVAAELDRVDPLPVEKRSPAKPRTGADRAGVTQALIAAGYRPDAVARMMQRWQPDDPVLPSPPSGAGGILRGPEVGYRQPGYLSPFLVQMGDKLFPVTREGARDLGLESGDWP